MHAATNRHPNLEGKFASSVLVNTLIFLLSFALVLAAVVTFHELGHYGVAKLFGTKVDRFSIGFGKPIARFTRRSGEEWVVGSLPLGGYVKFAGDSSAASVPDHEKLNALRDSLPADEASRLFQFKPVWQRILIVLAGPVANFVLAVLILAGLAWMLGVRDFAPVISEVVPDGAAAEAGFAPGDRIVSLDGREVDDVSDIINYVSLRSDTPIRATVERDSRQRDIVVTPERTTIEDVVGGRADVGRVGIMFRQPADFTPRRVGPVEALAIGTGQVGDTIGATGTYIRRIFTGAEDGKAMGGVLRIAAITGKAGVDASAREVPMSERVRGTVLTLVSLMATLSIGLGIANLLPIPMLDGGHLLFYSYEAVAGRPVSERAQDVGVRIGLAVLLGLFVVLTVNDVGYIRSLFS